MQPPPFFTSKKLDLISIFSVLTSISCGKITKMKLTKVQKEKIQEIGKKYKLKLMLLHGSYATGRQKEGSDLDIAVVGKKALKSEDVTKILFDLEDIFGNDCTRELDVKSLHGVDPLFLFKVVSESNLLYGNLHDYSEFRAYAFKVYNDSRDLRNLEKLLVNKYQKHLNLKYA